MPDHRLRIAATADLHYGKHSAGQHSALFDQVSEEADVLLLCGDLTNYGLPEEAELLARDLREHIRIPMLAVLGNHDLESGHEAELAEIVEGAGVEILDGGCAVIGRVGFAGVRGFGGGFGRWALSPWGEPATKAFVQAAVDEELKLEAALARLDTPWRVVLLHYAPVRATVEGEPAEIIPFLGSQRLEEPLNRFDVTAAFHGHAHHGSLEGRTSKDVPIYNVSIPLLKRLRPDEPPFHLLELDLSEQAEAPQQAEAG